MGSAATVETGSLVIEETWPVAWVRYRASPSDAEAAALLREYERFYSTQSNYGIVICSNRHVTHTAAQNQRMGHWMKEHHSGYEGRLRGIAFVSDSARIRFGLSIVFLIQPLTVPYTVTSSEVDAEAFIRSRVAQ